MLYALICACEGNWDKLQFSITEEAPFFTIGCASLEGNLSAMKECFIGYITALFNAATVEAPKLVDEGKAFPEKATAVKDGAVGEF